MRKMFPKSPPCGKSHQLSKNAKKTANDWLIIPIYLYDNKITICLKGDWGEDLDPTGFFLGYGWHREMERFSAGAVMGAQASMG